jgi:hypothetical protein
VMDPDCAKSRCKPVAALSTRAAAAKPAVRRAKLRDVYHRAVGSCAELDSDDVIAFNHARSSCRVAPVRPVSPLREDSQRV